MGQVAGDQVQVSLRLRGENRVQALVELFESQASAREVLLQFSSDGVALTVPDTQAWLHGHLPLRAARRLMMKRYIAIDPAATAESCQRLTGVPGHARGGGVNSGSSCCRRSADWSPSRARRTCRPGRKPGSG